MSRFHGYLMGEETLTAEDVFSRTKVDMSPFGFWNRRLKRAVTRNCYGFAADAKSPDIRDIYACLSSGKDKTVSYTFHHPWPGVSGGAPYAAMTPAALSEALVCDGFVSLPYKDLRKITIPRDHYLIAGYCCNTSTCSDYHFYRYHAASDTWYHKQSWLGRVQNLDARARIIRNPQEAARGRYTDFIGFFLSPPDRRPLNIIVQDEQGNIVFGRVPTDAQQAAPPARPETKQGSDSFRQCVQDIGARIFAAWPSP